MLNPLMNINLDQAERDRMKKSLKNYIQSVNMLTKRQIVSLEEWEKAEKQGLKEIKIMNKVCDRIFKK